MNFNCVFGHLFYRGGPANIPGWVVSSDSWRFKWEKPMAEIDKNQPAMFDDTSYVGTVGID